MKPHTTKSPISDASVWGCGLSCEEARERDDHHVEPKAMKEDTIKHQAR